MGDNRFTEPLATQAMSPVMVTDDNIKYWQTAADFLDGLPPRFGFTGDEGTIYADDALGGDNEAGIAVMEVGFGIDLRSKFVHLGPWSARLVMEGGWS